jgi:HAE1 family hydrophobic/amphiphilic exporter-1
VSDEPRRALSATERRFGELQRRPVAITMALVAMLVVGAVAWRMIPLELIPSGLTPPFLFVQVPTLRSAPEDIEASVAIPVEDALATVRGVRHAATRIEPNSASFILQFGDRTDMDDAYNQVRERLERVAPELGDDVGQWLIFKYNPADDPVIWFGATVEEGVEDPARMIEELVVPRLERIPGVSRVDVSGAARRAVAVEIDELLADAAGTNVVELVQRLARENFALSAGSLHFGESQMPVRAMARLQGLEELRAIPVGSSRTLEDVADVYVENRAERAVYRVNRRPGIFIEVYRDSSANTVDLAAEVHRVIDFELAADPRAQGLNFHYFFDQGELILGSLRTLQTNALQGAVLAVLVLIVFLRHLAMTLIVAVAIPICLMLTVAVMYFDGWTLNLLSLMGLMLSVGMVVDNAIVVVESIQRRRAEGMPAAEASARGTSDIALAIAVSTMTTVVVFVPIVLMSGNAVISFYLAQIGFPLCVSLLASLAIALLVVPLLSTRALRATAPVEPRWITATEGAYAAVLRWVLRRRGDATVIVLLVFATIMIPARAVVSTDQSEPNINDFRVFVNLPEAAGWDERVSILLGVEEALWQIRDELGVRDMYTRIGGNRFGRPQVRVFLVDPSERSLTRDETIERALASLVAPPGVTFSVSWEAPTAAGRTTSISVTGPDTRRLAELSDEVARRLRTIEGVVSVRSESNEEGEPEARLRLDRERVFRSGLTAMAVGGLVDFAVRGREVASLALPGGDLPVFVRGSAAGDNALRNLERVELPGPIEGIALGSVTETQIARGFDRIDRENGRTVVTLTIQTSREDVSGSPKTSTP